MYYSNILERYILGFDDNIDNNSFFSIFPNTCFRLLGVNIKQAYGKNREAVKKIKSIIKEYLIKHNYSFIKFILNEEVLLYVINYRMNEDKKIVSEFGKYIENKILQESIFFIITPNFNNLNNIREIYNKKFNPYLALKFYYKNKILLDTEKVTLEEKIEKFDSSKYDNLLKRKDFTSAITLMKKYIDLAVVSKMDEYKLKNLVKNLLYNLIVSLEEYDLEAEELRQGYFKKIDKLQYLEEFINVINEIILELNKFINKNVNLEEDRINVILEYIESHYDKALELSDISKAFNFNYYYLSYYFNNHCKEGFSEYLNRIRIEKACELLKDNKLYVSEISSMIGYSDHSYFCRVFKKITGDTPSRYRRIVGMQGVIDSDKEAEAK